MEYLNVTKTDTHPPVPQGDRTLLLPVELNESGAIDPSAAKHYYGEHHEEYAAFKGQSAEAVSPVASPSPGTGSTRTLGGNVATDANQTVHYEDDAREDDIDGNPRLSET